MGTLIMMLMRILGTIILVRSRVQWKNFNDYHFHVLLDQQDGKPNIGRAVIVEGKPEINDGSEPLGIGRDDITLIKRIKNFFFGNEDDHKQIKGENLSRYEKKIEDAEYVTYANTVIDTATHGKFKALENL